eukprot:9499196-Pyramimonas_sp.AAC.1
MASTVGDIDMQLNVRLSDESIPADLDGKMITTMIPCKFHFKRGRAPTLVQIEVPEVKYPFRSSPGLRDVPEVAGAGDDESRKRHCGAIDKTGIIDSRQQCAMAAPTEPPKDKKALAAVKSSMPAPSS